MNVTNLLLELGSLRIVLNDWTVLKCNDCLQIIWSHSAVICIIAEIRSEIGFSWLLRVKSKLTVVALQYPLLSDHIWMNQYTWADIQNHLQTTQTETKLKTED